jgi:NADH dehydrogenase FAD-containing subunit
VLPELDPRLSATADRVLRERGVQVLTGTSVDEATAEGVRLSTGEFVATRTLIWCVGVRPDPLVEQLGLPLERGRIAVDTQLQVAGHPGVFACGDAAAVTRAYHLAAMPGNRIRTAVDWALDALLPRQRVHLGLVQAPAVPLDTG